MLVQKNYRFFLIQLIFSLFFSAALSFNSFAEDLVHSCAPIGIKQPEEARLFSLPSKIENKHSAQIIDSDYKGELETIWRSGPSDNRLDVVFLGDGYRDDEQEIFNKHVEEIQKAFFDEEPFKSYKNLINLHKVNIISQESGVSNDPFLGIEKNTALSSSLWCFSMSRSLCVDLDVTKSYARVNAPFYDQIVVVSNTNSYGGIAYQYSGIATLTGGHPLSKELFLHEFAHSFGKLADEYDGSSLNATYAGNEIERANVSILSEDQMRVHSSKWHSWLDIDPITVPGAENSIGIFEGGYNFSKGVFRPSKNSKMRSLGQPYNLPSMEALVVKLYEHVDLIEDSFPKRNLLSVQEDIFADVVASKGANLQINWYIDNKKVFQNSLVFDTYDIFHKTYNLLPGIYELKLEVIDKTNFVSDEKERLKFLKDQKVWKIVVDPEDANYISSQSNNDFPNLRCTFPNSFLSQVNIASLVNQDKTSLTGTASFRDSSGLLVSERKVFLSPSQKLDLSVHDFGLRPDSIGVFCFEAANSNWSGGLSLYAPSSESIGGFDFALYSPFVSPESEDSVLPLNTFSLVNGEKGSYNWIRLMDGLPGDGISLNGKLKVYNAAGKLLFFKNIKLQDGGRIDIAGHDILPANEVGLVEFSSTNGSSFYFEVTRYYPKSAGGFYSASSMQKASLSSEIMASAFESSKDVLPVVEILNPNYVSSEVLIVIRNVAGKIISSEVLELLPKSSFHYILSGSKIPSGDVGTVELKATKRISSRLLSYSYNSQGNVYSSAVKKMNLDSSNKKVAQFNTFLQQKNILRLINRSDKKQLVNFDVYDYSNKFIYKGIYLIEAFGVGLIPLNLKENIYGSILINSEFDIEAETLLNLEDSFVLQLSAR